MNKLIRQLSLAHCVIISGFIVATFVPVAFCLVGVPLSFNETVSWFTMIGVVGAVVVALFKDQIKRIIDAPDILVSYNSDHFNESRISYKFEWQKNSTHYYDVIPVVISVEDRKNRGVVDNCQVRIKQIDVKEGGVYVKKHVFMEPVPLKWTSSSAFDLRAFGGKDYCLLGYANYGNNSFMIERNMKTLLELKADNSYIVFLEVMTTSTLKCFEFAVSVDLVVATVENIPNLKCSVKVMPQLPARSTVCEGS